MSALSSVDLPAFTLPEMASRIGPSSRSTIAAAQPRVRRRPPRLAPIGERRDPGGEVVGHQTDLPPSRATACRLPDLSELPGLPSSWAARAARAVGGRSDARRAASSAALVDAWMLIARALELVTQPTLGPAQPVSRVLVHLEGDLVDELARSRLGLPLSVGALPLALHLEQLAPDDRAHDAAAGGMMRSVV